MKIDTTQPFCIVYALFKHEYLGYLIDPFAVQLDADGRFSLCYQKLSSMNAAEFAAQLDQTDYLLIRWSEEMHPDAVAKRFSNKKMSSSDFFLKTYDKEKGNRQVQEAIFEIMEKRRAEYLARLVNKRFFIMASDGNPTYRQIHLLEEPVEVKAHYCRQADGTRFFLQLFHGGTRLTMTPEKSGIVICTQPAWLLIGQNLYHLPAALDGKKLYPFLKKEELKIPPQAEEQYFKNILPHFLSHFEVTAEGLDIRVHRHKPIAVLSFAEMPVPVQAGLFQFANAETEATEFKIQFDLHFCYGEFKFRPGNEQPCTAIVEGKAGNYVFHKIIRSPEKERAQLQWLIQHGLEIGMGKVNMPGRDALQWLQTYQNEAVAQGIQIQQTHQDNQKKYFIGETCFELQAHESNDWFDIRAKIRFGAYEIPFLQIRKYILSGTREFKLPNGEMAIIPEAWFTRFTDLLHFTQEKSEQIVLQKHHVALLHELERQEVATLNISHRLAQLRHFEQPEDYPLPVQFRGQLRPYQKAGYNWLHFLREYNFGGCLADDMGLGKTVQTLALLQAEKERMATEGTPPHASLLVLPTSLIYNWEMEARKFTPKLRILKYTGVFRYKNTAIFNKYDLVITSYGIVRQDIDELLEKYYFNYIILDEAQAIKNPDSAIAKAVRRLHGKRRLTLTGTPVENSALDLWSQMAFANPGLLGSQSYFQREFVAPIEKKNDEARLQKLQALVKPFILRRHKSQVAQDLPEKMEQIHYSTMTEEQKEHYEKVKSKYRNEILSHIEKNGLAKSQILILQGLTQLRQLACHPQMVQNDYTGDSGKMRDVMHYLENIVAEGHKILIFSQFVKHLALLRTRLEQKGYSYAYLDGSTRDRQEQVDKFMNKPDVAVFLLSIKAGGTGLNLTAADYVFLLDPWWNPAVEAQAIDRAHRIGQENKVMVYKFITQNSVEEKILLLQQKKRRIAEGLIFTDETFIKQLTARDIDALLS
ncbi:MAG: SNF2-related protein [Cytophagales bacterium]|nr:SNF2-related protein [Bernardetiaceae bacterium]MDW8204533.1 SNF2-related protein [Cytophagales bacterium]